jgi:hypothetical protein
VRNDKGTLWKQVDQLLQRRPGWKFQAIATPGAPPLWCFESGGRSELSVTVDGGSIRIYEAGSDHEVKVGNTDELVAWLNSERPGSLRPQKDRVIDKRAGFFRWD